MASVSGRDGDGGEEIQLEDWIHADMTAEESEGGLAQQSDTTQSQPSGEATQQQNQPATQAPQQREETPERVKERANIKTQIAQAWRKFFPNNFYDPFPEIGPLLEKKASGVFGPCLGKRKRSEREE